MIPHGETPLWIICGAVLLVLALVVLRVAAGAEDDARRLS